MRNILALIFVFGLTTPARATVDAYLTYQVPYRHLQTDDVCFLEQTMLASIGIPQASIMRATFSPNAVFNEHGTPDFVNVNLLATSPPMTASYVSDGYDGGVMDYAMTVDVRALAAARGQTVSGRAETIRSAKLALLAMARSLDAISRGSYRLRVTFVGLPSQAGLAGTPLYATTRYAYGPGSPLLAAYEKELVNAGGTCP